MNPINGNSNIDVERSDLLPIIKENSSAAISDGGSFKDLLKGLVDQVDSLQKDADASIKGLVTGEGPDVHNVAVKMEEASVAFDLMMEIRNKLVEAYQEISRMQP